MHTKTRTTAWLLVIVLMASGSAFAIRKGGLVGKVIDPDGNPIEGVTVTATSKEVPGGFNVRDVRGFDAIHDRYVYVRCRRGKHYLLTMANACLGLQDSIAVAVANDFNHVCSHDGAWLTYRDFERTRRCVILRVEAVDDRAAALDLVARRTQPRVDEVYSLAFIAFLCAFSRARRKSSAS